MTISDRAVVEIKKSNTLIARLMILFDRGQNTIENWMTSKDVRLTTVDAVRVIGEESGLTEEEILEQETEAAAN